MSLRFEDFIDNSKWTTLKEHYSNFNKNLEANIELATKIDRREDIRKGLQEKYHIKICKEDKTLQEKLKKELLSGNVAAVDGTCVDYDLIMGFQARIGIIAINYKNIRKDYTVYISEPFIAYDKTNIDEILDYTRQKKLGRVGLSSSHIRGIMLYKEREFILDRTEKYKMIQGDILPYELKTGQGRLKGLPQCLDLGRRLLKDKHIVAIQTTTTDPQLRIIGDVLLPGEYAIIRPYWDDLDTFLNGVDEFSKPANFSSRESEDFSLFIQDVQNEFVVGVYKASNRAYIFYTSQENVEEMINLVFADSHFQPLRGFPLLLDYADTLCSHLLPSQDFKMQIEAKLARKKKLDYEIPERQLRRR